MSSGAAWLMGMAESKRQQDHFLAELAAKHRHLKKNRKRFMALFGVDVDTFYTDAILGFDLIAFDDWLREHIEAYDEDRESMADFIKRRYGQAAARLVQSLI